MTRGDVLATAVLVGAMQSWGAAAEQGLLRISQSAYATAADHHARGVAFHNDRRLDEASREYVRALDLDPPRDLDGREWAIVRRFAPRLYTTKSEFFPLKDVAAVMHPDERLIAYHLFWEDDIDFPEDNDPCDHEVLWVQYGANGRDIERLWTYFHGRLLEGGAAALADARSHDGRARINVQWGKHGSMPVGWEQMPIVANAGETERDYLPLERTITIEQYNRATFEKLRKEGRRMIDHPLGRRLGWPARFTGDWKAFSDFSRLVDPLAMLDRTRMAKVSRWNSATIDQHFLTYNFRPKTEWPTAARARAATARAGVDRARSRPGSAASAR